MSQLPPPDFNSGAYERPNEKWVCGRLKDGQPCRNGPSGKGSCGATADCVPALQPGVAGNKGYYICTRSKERGGPCEEGPNPDGSCCHPPLKCQPGLNLRAKRGMLTKSVIAATFGVLLVIFYGSQRWNFISPGELSLKHRSLAFEESVKASHGDNQSCAACHSAASSGPINWIDTAFNADPKPFELHKLFLQPPPKTTAIDTSCQKCHSSHGFHEPNVAWEYSCSACHREHQGSGPMMTVNAQHCTRCHGDKEVMQAAAKKGHSLEANLFDFQRDLSRASFQTIRPVDGYTKVIHEFSEDHPEFQVHAEKYKDLNTLRFSHATHVGDNPKMTLLNGKKLDCASCHKPGPGGIYYTRVTFENNCKACHSLQFDKENPGLTIPHGNAKFVHAFLRSLPQQYADFASREKKITAKADVEKFVRERLTEMRQQYGPGEELEQKVFFSDERTGPATDIGGLGNQGRSIFSGCAYCHEVKTGSDLPVITHPVMPERWLSRGRFDHSKHTHLNCATCHQATASKEVSDILLPSKNMCAVCHKPQGAARNDCFECHGYHNKPDAALLNALQKASK